MCHLRTTTTASPPSNQLKGKKRPSETTPIIHRKSVRLHKQRGDYVSSGACDSEVPFVRPAQLVVPVCVVTSETEPKFFDESDDCITTDILPVSVHDPNKTQNNLSLLNQVNNAQFKDYSSRHTTHLESTRYCVIVSGKGEKTTALKRSVVWRLENSVTAISKDRNVRVDAMCHDRQNLFQVVNEVGKLAIKQGDWCVFLTEEKDNFLLGQVKVLVHYNPKKCSQRFVRMELCNSNRIVRHTFALV